MPSPVCALGRIRTCDTRFRRAVLYPLSYEGVGGLGPPGTFAVYRVRGSEAASLSWDIASDQKPPPSKPPLSKPPPSSKPPP